jgi:ArsR family transcriptional regulator
VTEDVRPWLACDGRAHASNVIEASMSEPSVRDACEVLAAVADPVRLGVLRQLRAGRRCVCELQRVEPIAVNLLSYHLRVLRAAGLVVATKRGRWVDYDLAPGAIERLHAALPPPPGESG